MSELWIQRTRRMPLAASAWNQAQLFSSASVEWRTPDWLVDVIHSEFVLQLDACATGQNAQCERHITPEQNALTTEWIECMPPTRTGQAVWMNPPWSRGIGAFVQRAYEQSRRHRLVVVCLLPASTDTRWWHDYVMRASEIRLIKGRLHFIRDGGHTGPATKGCAIVVFTPWHGGPPSFSSLSQER